MATTDLKWLITGEEENVKKSILESNPIDKMPSLRERFISQRAGKKDNQSADRESIHESRGSTRMFERSMSWQGGYAFSATMS